MSVGMAQTRRPARLSSPLSQTLAIAALLAVLIGWLALLGRPLTCPCGTIRLFVADATSTENSQQFADFYSGLHVIFGLGLWAFVHRLKPHWSIGQTVIVAVASSVVWEAVENIPVVIEIFNHAPGSPAYTGDSILNALADTLFVVIGFLAASRLPALGILALAVLLEVVVSFAIDDGLVLGTLRIFGAPV